VEPIPVEPLDSVAPVEPVVSYVELLLEGVELLCPALLVPYVEPVPDAWVEGEP
jgi:hypothetical protein